MLPGQARSLSVLLWTIGTGAAVWYWFGPVPGVIAAVVMYLLCQAG